MTAVGPLMWILKRTLPGAALTAGAALLWFLTAKMMRMKPETRDEDIDPRLLANP